MDIAQISENLIRVIFRRDNIGIGLLLLIVPAISQCIIFYFIKKKEYKKIIRCCLVKLATSLSSIQVVITILFIIYFFILLDLFIILVLSNAIQQLGMNYVVSIYVNIVICIFSIEISNDFVLKKTRESINNKRTKQLDNEYNKLNSKFFARSEEIVLEQYMNILFIFFGRATARWAINVGAAFILIMVNIRTLLDGDIGGSIIFVANMAMLTYYGIRMVIDEFPSSIKNYMNEINNKWFKSDPMEDKHDYEAYKKVKDMLKKMYEKYVDTGQLEFDDSEKEDFLDS